MNALERNPWLSAILGVLLVVPGITLFVLLNLNIEPPMGPLEPYLARNPDGGPHVLGSLIAFNAIVVLPVIALILNLGILMRALRKGVAFTSHPLNLLVTLTAASIVLAFVGAILIDQYPCWIGVPNCD